MGGPLRKSSRGVTAVALASPVNRLVNGLGRRVSWPRGVELRVVACGKGERSLEEGYRCSCDVPNSSYMFCSRS